MNFVCCTVMSGKFQNLFAQSNESETFVCNVFGLSECKKRNVLPLICSSTSFEFVGNGYLSKNSNNVIALNFWRMKLYSVLEDISSHKLWSVKLYSVLEDISSHKPVIQLNVPCFRSCICHRCFFEEPWFWADRCSSFSISSELLDEKIGKKEDVSVENKSNVPSLSKIFSKMSSVVASVFSETFEALNCWLVQSLSPRCVLSFWIIHIFQSKLFPSWRSFT